MRALGNHLVILADSMGNIIPETKGAVSKTGKASSKVKKSVAKDADKCGNGKPKLNKKGDQMMDKKVVVKKTSTKVNNPRWTNPQPKRFHLKIRK